MTAPFTPDTARAAIGTMAGDYELVELVGIGGMGAVYRATDRHTRAVVAVKVFGPSVIEAGALARFYQEARVHQALDHPRIARCLGLASTGAAHRPCLVMEFVEGESLAEILADRGSIDPGAALRIIADVARAAAHAHAHGVVHRDITPGNVRLNREGAAMLLDFGIAKPRDAKRLTTPGNVIGTPRYLSPEQLLGEEATPASDVWALGVLLYELTTGRAPFDDGSPEQVWRSVSAGDYIAPSRCAPESIDPDTRAHWARVDAIVASCLVREPRQRRIGAAEIAGGPAPAAPVAAATFARPGRRAIATIAVTAIIAAALAAAWWWPAPSGVDPAESVHHIDVSDGHAEVIVNGHRVGRTPLTYHGRFGDTIDVQLEMSGYETRHEQIQLGVEGTSTFTMRPLDARKDRP